jgi:hypothetical protein
MTKPDENVLAWGQLLTDLSGAARESRAAADALTQKLVHQVEIVNRARTLPPLANPLLADAVSDALDRFEASAGKVDLVPSARELDAASAALDRALDAVADLGI